MAGKERFSKARTTDVLERTIGDLERQKRALLDTIGDLTLKVGEINARLDTAKALSAELLDDATDEEGGE